MKLKSTLPMTGVLSISKIFKDGTEELVFREENVITLAVKQKILSGMYLSVTSDPITSLHIGTGGTLDPDGLYPKPVSQNLTALYSDYLTIPTSYTLAPSVPSVTFLATVSETQANDQLITEAALYTAAGVMFNIKTFPGVPKKLEFALSFSWAINLA